MIGAASGTHCAMYRSKVKTAMSKPRELKLPNLNSRHHRAGDDGCLECRAQRLE